MISSWGDGLVPWGDDLPKRTWRQGEDIGHQRRHHAYPVAGCQGEPLRKRCPWCRGEGFERASGVLRLPCLSCGGCGRQPKSEPCRRRNAQAARMLCDAGCLLAGPSWGACACEETP